MESRMESRGESRVSHASPVPVSGSGIEEDPPLASLVPPLSARAARSLRATQWPDEFTLTLERAEVARILGLDAAAEWAKFKDHALKDGVTHKNWDAAWRYWCRRAPEFQRRQLR
jgi:hypothetical protein